MKIACTLRFPCAVRHLNEPLNARRLFQVAHLSSLVGQLEGWTGSEAAATVDLKLQLALLPDQMDRTWIESFFEKHEADLVREGYVTGVVAERLSWVKCARGLDALLEAAGGGVAKKEMWTLSEGCGDLTGCVGLERARKMREAERQLGQEETREQMMTLLHVAGRLTGSPAVQRAEMLLSAEADLLAMMRREEGCTVHELQAAVRRCRPLRGSEALDEARVSLAAEMCFKGETR